ncbi:TIR domain-containing protein [Burkholderia contaminans]|uniref:TIR domain-containing protein n=1 Tax=Burkholderia contaminans TaxID=488447 RepID=A0A3N8QQF5_9BURK|nr:TIR domain-containing protein [Burkholderia contaminans]RQT26034.1 TIR domain-containing protein [Burkholderia contaminans]
MKIFVSWSKEPAKTIAVELKHFLMMVLRTANAWVSELDIEKGKRWAPAIAQELESTDTGIICVTSHNMREPWLHFEAGALSKSVEDSHIHPLCIGIGKNELPSTLSQFQATVFDQEDMLRLVIALNASQDKPEDESALRERFVRGWAGLEKSVADAVAKYPSEAERTQAPAWSAKEPPIPVLADGEVAIVKALSQQGSLRPDQIAYELRPLNISNTRLSYYFDRLIAAGFVDLIGSYTDPDQFVLTAKGRALAVENDWA